MLAVIYDLPFGRGRWIGGGMNRIADAVVGGWSLDTVMTLQSGQPIAIFMDSPQLADGNQRPNVTCSNLTTGISFYRAAAFQEPYLNTDCFGDRRPGSVMRPDICRICGAPGFAIWTCHCRRNLRSART